MKSHSLILTSLSSYFFSVILALPFESLSLKPPTFLILVAWGDMPRVGRTITERKEKIESTVVKYKGKNPRVNIIERRL